MWLFLTPNRQPKETRPIIPNMKTSRHGVDHFAESTWFAAIMIPCAIAKVAQSIPSFHANSSLFLSPHAHNRPKAPNKIFKMNIQKFASFKAERAPDSKVSVLN